MPVDGAANQDLEAIETVHFSAVMGEGDIGLIHSPEVVAFLHKVNQPCSWKLPASLRRCCRRRVTIVALDVDRGKGSAFDGELGPEVNRLVQGWSYFIGAPSVCLDSFSLPTEQDNGQQPQELS